MANFATIIQSQGHDVSERVVVLAIPDSGPYAGKEILTSVDRNELVSVIEDLASFKKSKWSKVYLNVRHAVRQALTKTDIPTQNQDLLANLPILFACKVCFSQQIEVLAYTHLMELSLLIDDNESLPWNKRGMLPPDLLERFNLSGKVTFIG